MVDVEAFALIRSLVEFSASDEYAHKTGFDRWARATPMSTSWAWQLPSRNIPMREQLH